ncbi:MAG: DUF4926 domain-containing protein [Cyanobacteria bacterium CRU_2_1]|nr:DUF4926 domain-containing protein [Cyanobacteria bacterium RU_5_0]NJR62467.1 DUF4926 domain-containing protein [Cyanobacteria bacterium CRU_2_1]
MDFPRYTDVVLTVNLPDEHLQVGDIGTVVERHDVPGLEPGYSVEFFDMLGKPIAIVTVPARMLRQPTHADRPTTRSEAISA